MTISKEIIRRILQEQSMSLKKDIQTFMDFFEIPKKDIEYVKPIFYSEHFGKIWKEKGRQISRREETEIMNWFELLKKFKFTGEKAQFIVNELPDRFDPEYLLEASKSNFEFYKRPSDFAFPFKDYMNKENAVYGHKIDKESGIGRWEGEFDVRVKSNTSFNLYIVPIGFSKKVKYEEDKILVGAIKTNYHVIIFPDDYNYYRGIVIDMVEDKFGDDIWVRTFGRVKK